MSNNNSYWGNKFGFIHKDGTLAFVVRQLSSGKSNSGQHQTAPDPRGPIAEQSKRDKAKYQLNGMPVLYDKRYNGHATN